MFTKNTRNVLLGGCAALVCSLHASKMPDWTIAVYMEAGTPDMYYWLNKNINDMALANSDHKKLNIVTQVHIEKSDAWRYVVRQDMIKPKENVPVGEDCAQNIVDFMTWTVKKYPARHYGLVVWGHGFGILDPSYRPNSTDPFAWDVEPDEPGLACTSGVCPLNNQGIPTRGFMFNNSQKFINNTSMVAMLKSIQETALKGKKLDFLGTDCCKMAMLEVGYQIKDSVQFLVGSQNCELKDGWNYKDFFSSFNDQPLDSLAAVQAIVKTYGTYYEKNTVQNTYTLSALDLSQVSPLVANLNDVAALSKKLMAENKPVFNAILLNARARCPSMCQASYYLDLAAVYANLLEELGKPEAGVLNPEVVATLKNVLAQGLELIKPVVVAKVGGTAVANLGGISIYFPRNRIDESYASAPFGLETAWLSFLQDVIA